MPVNALIHESSPYLLQHAHNPVNWQPWGKEAFAEAKRLNKMVIISIGYAACHWCHVMAHESFENEDIAKLMNDHFVCIKVDREERPDVDIIYMAAAQLINGNGGWPLNALALPDGRPFFAATYFPKDRWMQLLQYFMNEWETNQKALTEQADHLAGGIAQVDRLPFANEVVEFEPKDAGRIFDSIYKSTDKRDGGLSSSVKFPMPSVWEWLLEYYHFSGNPAALEIVRTSLNKMKDGGIYDQIGGGFARYATDPYWHIPHFEKMLFDNAQLIALYSHAFQVTHDEEYRRIAEETISFLKRELFDGRGFYSSIDADSEKEEGKYYVWTKSEVIRLLGKEAESFCKYFGITESGNWEDGKNVPDRNWARQFDGGNRPFDQQVIDDARKKLFDARSLRVRPALDDKILTGWNALASSGLLAAAKAFGRDDYAEVAEKNIAFLLETRFDRKNSVVFRNRDKNNKTTFGFLDDYAFLIDVLIDYYQYGCDIHYLHRAMELTEVALENFYDENDGMFLYNDVRFEEVVIRPRQVSDDVIPSANSVMAENLMRLGMLFDRTDLITKARNMLRTVRNEMQENPAYYSNWARTLLSMIKSPFEVAVIGKDFQQQIKQLNVNFLPDAILCGSDEQENLPLLKQRFIPGKTFIYVCMNKTCQMPVLQSRDALRQMQEQRAGLNMANKL